MDPCNNPKKTRRQSHMPHVGDETKKEKKLLHRNIERQRRQEMAILFASLRNQLPQKYIKGKRAMSDHVNGAVTFIKDTQTRIKELSARRDELKRETGDPTTSQTRSGSGSGSSRSEPATVMVQPCVSGFEVVVTSSASGLEAWPLSRVLEVLHEQGLEVISSLTARVNERLMYTIQVEVNSFGCFDLAWLQQKLIDELVLSTTRH
ncbi:PREDICTED: transcription factor bHLH120 [Camelina sativa]|uniref:Transcription factor bHLH120 n=1 Tax=Camelina sativa TaxID=90675 RepID=A0ABM0UKZ7_CAMSA|nr:PREDICTED: transcription factor bHLH120 [Camelina sativa]